MADREHQQNIIEQQSRELDGLRNMKVYYEELNANHESVRSELVSVKSELSSAINDYEKRITELEEELGSSKRQAATLERKKYELESQLESSLSDVMIARHDLSLRQQELDNIHQALNNLEKEHDNKIRFIKNEHGQHIDKIDEEWLQKLNNEKENYEQDVAFYKQQLDNMNAKHEDEVLLRRKLEIDISQEKRRLNEALEVALNKLQHSQEDVVDRTLVKNLVVTYFRQKR